MIAAYIRVYSNKQSAEPQEEIIGNFARCENIEIDKWYKEAGNSPRTNKRIENIIKSLHPGDRLIIADMTRLSRKMIEIMHLLLLCIERKIVLHSVSEGYTFEDNLDSKTLAFTFGLVSEIERKLISVRTKEALALTKSKGIVLGRPKGSQQMGRLLPYKEQIQKDLKKENATYAGLAKQYNVSLSSFKRFVKDYLTGAPAKKKKKK